MICDNELGKINQMPIIFSLSLSVSLSSNIHGWVSYYVIVSKVVQASVEKTKPSLHLSVYQRETYAREP